MENINGQIQSSEGDAFYDYTRPGLAHTDPDLSFETGGDNPLPPTGDTIGGESPTNGDLPLKLYKADDEKVAVTPGYVGNYPVHDTVDGSPLEITTTGTCYVWLKCTVTDRAVTAVLLEVGPIGALPEDTAGTAYVLLGSAFYDSGVISVVDSYQSGSLQYRYGGHTYHYFF